ncbi:MarR family transcriptional regulator [Clostridium gasigenes]|uniref:MarR family winged helix-turn-helix transcriptional regulator n=1 Tax=Clostridium gasigenes TaxID=94869 RepID=UPI0014383AA4|nr:MarR family transcriptional regulator [Clostridium gasigenes]NKF05657.1 MarR family transcriptional regulator [Clostridium gasigenes]QSW19095.1 MarR family transcriptional regulator [Clostridium gasigenes]
MDEKLKLENQLCFKIYSISKSIIRIYGPLLNRIDLTYPQYLVMMVLWENRKISFKDISYKLKMKTGTLTPIITKLENNGYLKRVKDETDDRKIYISITEKGMELEKKAKDIPKKLACNIQLKEQDYFKYLQDFDDLIKKLDSIEKYIK